MKRTVLTLLAAVLLLAAAMGLSSCEEKSRFDELNELGYTLTVAYDASGGLIGNSKSVLYDAFNPTETPSFKLVDPESTLRDNTNPIVVSKPGHFLVGWYTERTPIDESDLSKGYTYSGRWDFDTDVYTAEAGKSYDANDVTLTLYAAWLPYYSFEFYYVDEGGEPVQFTQEKADGTVAPYTYSGIELKLPYYKDGAASYSMEKFPKREGYTFLSAYSDADCTTPYTADITGLFDLDTAASSCDSTVKIYTKWKAGDWYRISSAEQLIECAKPDGCYDITADLDFDGLKWPKDFYEEAFTGQIKGNGHKISNIELTVTSRLDGYGLFSSIGADATICDVTFDNVTLTLNPSRVNRNASVGLLAGKCADGATFTDVTLSGSLLFGDKGAGFKASANSIPTLGLVSGSGTPTGVTYTVTAAKVNEAAGDFTVAVYDDEIVIK
jgi:hypothetical protein